MKEERSASQINFGFLPGQTVDLRNSVWRVSGWRNPLHQSQVDVRALRDELCRLAGPWEARGTDGQYVSDLRKGVALSVYSLDRESGVDVEPFPRTWVCRDCNRVHRSAEQERCRCGSSRAPTNLHFVGYHPACGRLHEPRIRRCQEHNDVQIVWPDSASAADIIFRCPICGHKTQKGLVGAACDCGGPGSILHTVHRAASVYTPHPVVIVNPPSPERLQRLHDAGGPPRALSWILAGMPTRTLEEWSNTATALRSQLLRSGLGEETAEQMVELAVQQGDVMDDREAGSPERVGQQAESEAVTMAMAFSESRTRIADLASKAPDGSQRALNYNEEYPEALRQAGIESVDFIDSFPVFTGHYGYTRGAEPWDSRLVPFRSQSGYAVYGDLGMTEAMFIALDPQNVVNWLERRGLKVGMGQDSTSARQALLRAAEIPGVDETEDQLTTGTAILTLVHSFAHRFVRMAAVHAGIDRNSLSELLVPSHLGFFVYAAARGDFVLGGLQAVFENDLHTLVRAFLHEEHRCPLDPGCSHSGGACMACLHLGEPSCRLHNRFLSRGALVGPYGYLSQ